MTEREILLKRVQVCDFALNDVALFLDTHPDDQAAIAHYKKYMELRKRAVAEYEENFGPLTKESYDGGARWIWVDGPWPWQKEASV
ncbi:MAG: spore coat protein CotJB [Oscillospiraceae bacterium]|jgi:spore coat protein JB|nr:spore coat protein CotJB [Oscillospiraceae bacterium]